MCLPAWSSTLRVSHTERLFGRRKAYCFLVLACDGCSSVCSAASCRVHWQRPRSESVSKGTIGWLVLYVDSQRGSVDTACDGKRVALRVRNYTSPCAHCRGLKGMIEAIKALINYLVDPASSHMLVSKTKPCMSQYTSSYDETANGSLNQLWFLGSCQLHG